MIAAWEAEEVEEAEEVKERTARSGPVRKYTDVMVYQQAYRLALETCKLSRALPRQGQFELGRQLQASSRSAAANIVEGWAKRHSAAEFKRHLLIAGGECAETKFWIELARDEGFLPAGRCDFLRAEYAKLGMMMHNL